MGSGFFCGGCACRDYQTHAALAVGDVGIDVQRDPPIIVGCRVSVMVKRCEQCGVCDTCFNPIILDREDEAQPPEERVRAIYRMRPQVPRQLGGGR